MIRCALLTLTLIGLCLTTGAAPAATKRPANATPDFPPGQFSDGGQYKLADFEGKVVVLFFFESECPTCKGKIPARNAVVDQFKGRPVKFIAVGPHNSLADIKSYVGETHLKMPVFVDTFNAMESLYGQTLSLQNIWQFRIIGPKGNVVGYDMTPEAIESALKNVTWKYKEEGYDPGLNAAIDLLEWNQYAPAVRMLASARKAKGKYGESAEKLYQAVRAEAEQWKKQADKLSDSDPVTAYDAYQKVATVFAGDDLAKSVGEPLKQLQANKAVQNEIAARQMYQQLYTVVPKAKPQQKSDLAQFCQSIAAKYPGTPTAEKAAALAAALTTGPKG